MFLELKTKVVKLYVNDEILILKNKTHYKLKIEIVKKCFLMVKGIFYLKYAFALIIIKKFHEK